MNNWLGVVSQAHVGRGVKLGIAQIQHGKRAGLARMHPGDTLIYYSPRTEYPEGEPLKAFTAIGEVADGDIWQAHEGDFHPYRRTVRYQTGAREVPLSEVTDRLELTSTEHWGYRLRLGLVPLSEADAAIIREAMMERR